MIILVSRENTLFCTNITINLFIDSYATFWHVMKCALVRSLTPVVGALGVVGGGTAEVLESTPGFGWWGTQSPL